MGGVHLDYGFSRYDIQERVIILTPTNIKTFFRRRITGFGFFPILFPVKPDSLSMNAAIYELNFSSDLFSTDEVKVFMGANFAQKIGPKGNDGFSFQPAVGNLQLGPVSRFRLDRWGIRKAYFGSIQFLLWPTGGGPTAAPTAIRC